MWGKKKDVLLKRIEAHSPLCCCSDEVVFKHHTTSGPCPHTLNAGTSSSAEDRLSRGKKIHEVGLCNYSKRWGKMRWQEFAAPRFHLPFLAGGGGFKATKWKEKLTGDFRQSRRV